MGVDRAVYFEQRFGLSERFAVVTGGGSGIGAHCAKTLAAAGARVLVIGRRTEKLAEVADAIDGSWMSADLSVTNTVFATAQRIVEEHGAPDILINAAGINWRPPLDSLTQDQWDESLSLNLTAPFILGQEFGPRMADAGWGRIINISSQQSIRAFGNSGAYGVSKAGLDALTRSQAEAWSQLGVCVNSIAPGFVSTELTRPVFESPERASAMAARTMIGRHAKVEDLEGAVLFLASNASSYVTGQTLFVDGGMSVH